jgi:DNA (cytosine-5)-methyltransferase 1
MTITATDLFCGAGGSSTGAERVEGVSVVMAANHWATAIDVHQHHHPNARHDCADISQADPRRYPGTDILIASPECTNHSQAKGISRKVQDPSSFDFDPLAERSRATMWDVPRFAEQIDYQAIILENVVEAVKWRLFPAWRHAMESLGYDLHLLSHNSMHHGVAQSRDRLYIVATKDHLTPIIDLDFIQVGWCEPCGDVVLCEQHWKNGNTVGRYKQQWIWNCVECSSEVKPEVNPASSIIDWSIDCPTIGGRKRDLSQATRRRILAGLRRHGFVPVITAGAGNVHERTPGNRARTLDQPLAVQQASATHALAHPPGFLFNTAHGGRVSELDKPHPTVCASDDRQSLIIPLRNNGNAYRTSDPLGAVTAGGNHHGLLMRNNGPAGSGWACTPTDEPARTLTTKGHQSLIMPYYGKGSCTLASDPMTTVRTHDGHAVVDTSLATEAEVEKYIDDCGFRMLQPTEVAAAMAFEKGYIPTHLTKKDQVKLAGNAVTPPVMTWLVDRVARAMEAA